MVQIPEENFSPDWQGVDCVKVPDLGTEYEVLTAMLDFHRQTFEAKCAGLTPGQLSTMSVPPSRLSLHGMARHLAGVERWWFRVQFNGEESLPLLYYSDDDPSQDFESLDGPPEEAFAAWRAECDASRKVVAAASSLDQTGTKANSGAPFTLRRMLVHMIAEYARHNGQADLLRECIDGRTGA